MSPANLQTYLPTPHQKLAAIVLGLLCLVWILSLMRSRKMREDQALIWIFSILVLSVVVLFDPILLLISWLLGTKVPASAIILLAIVGLTIINIRLTSQIAIMKRQIANLVIRCSILSEYERERHDRGSEDSPTS